MFPKAGTHRALTHLPQPRLLEKQQGPQKVQHRLELGVQGCYGGRHQLKVPLRGARGHSAGRGATPRRLRYSVVILHRCSPVWAALLRKYRIRECGGRLVHPAHDVRVGSLILRPGLARRREGRARMRPLIFRRRAQGSDYRLQGGDPPEELGALGCPRWWEDGNRGRHGRGSGWGRGRSRCHRARRGLGTLGGLRCCGSGFRAEGFALLCERLLFTLELGSLFLELLALCGEGFVDKLAQKRLYDPEAGQP